MQTIYKYQLNTAQFTPQKLILQLANRKSILSVNKQGAGISLWCLVDTSVPEQTRTFNVYPTGASVPDKAVFIGTVIFHDGAFVLHVFDETEVV